MAEILNKKYDSLEEGTVKFARKVREIPVLDLGFRICFQFSQSNFKK